MAKKAIETITLMSSDEETADQVDCVQETEKLIVIKFENTANEKKTARKSLNNSVTSPKLSLKRKRNEESIQIGTSITKNKKILFPVEDETIFLAESCQIDPKRNIDEIATPSCLTSMDSSSAQNSSTSIKVNNILPAPPNSAFSDSDHVRNTSQPIISENGGLPGPSNPTTSAHSNKQKFEMLLEFAIPKLKNFSPSDVSKLRKILHNKLENAAESYTSSLEFSSDLDSIWGKIEKSPTEILEHFKELKVQLSAFKKRSKTKSELSSSSCTSPSLIPSNMKNASNSPKLSFDYGKVPNSVKTEAISIHKVCIEDSRHQKVTDLSSIKSNTSFAATEVLETKNNLHFTPILNSKFPLSKEDAQAKLDIKIKKLEKHLADLDKKIKKLLTEELSLDDLDDEDSTYIREDLYKRKFNQTWVALCKCKNRSSRLGRAMEKPFIFKGSRHQEINRAVEKLINKRKVSEKFPNYEDIYKLIKDTNDEVQVGLRESEYPLLAREIFEEVGYELKKRRQRDVERDLGCYLTDDLKLEDDPAEKDEELKRKLNNSVIEGEKKINEIIEKYAARQDNQVNEEEERDEDDEDKEDEEDVILEPEYNEEDDDLPETEPATPDSTDLASPKRIAPTEDGVAFVDIASDSDLGSAGSTATDPGYSALNAKKMTDPIQSTFAIDSIATEIPTEGESDSSLELPQL